MGRMSPSGLRFAGPDASMISKSMLLCFANRFSGVGLFELFGGVVWGLGRVLGVRLTRFGGHSKIWDSYPRRSVYAEIESAVSV